MGEKGESSGLDPAATGPEAGLQSRPDLERKEVLPRPPPEEPRIRDVREFLGPHVGKSPEEIHPRLRAGDPLGVHQLGMSRLREQAFLIDPDRLYERSLAVIAYAASKASWEHLGPDWLQRCVEVAMARILTDDQTEERLAPGSPPEDESFYRFIHLAFGIERGLVRRAAVRFNALPHRTRYAFFRLLVDGIPVDDCVREHGGTRDEVREDILNGFRALGHLGENETIGSHRRKKKKP